MFLPIILLTVLANCQILTTADFLYQPTHTNVYFKNNYVGIVFNLSQVYDKYNNTDFQGYLLNSNLKGDWKNNFAVTLRMPKGWYYDCAAAGVSASNTALCKFNIRGNITWLTQLGQFVKNTLNPPYWTMGLNSEKFKFNNSTIKSSIYNYFFRVYNYSSTKYFTAEMMFQADKAIQNEMRTGTNYTYANFLSQALHFPNIYSPIRYKAPGVSETASLQWYSDIPAYFLRVPKGIFTFEPVIFTNSNLATIQNLLSDNYTKEYFKRRFYVNSSFSYRNFSRMSTSLPRVRLTSTSGIDGITNTFAAAIWWIDFLIQGSLYNLVDIGLQASATDNFQSVFGPFPTLTPTALYYGSLMAILAGQKSPMVVTPSMSEGISSNIKIWGFKSTYMYKVLILNKDTNRSMLGSINIKIRSNQYVKMKCIYMRAQSLESKSENITIGGYSYIAGNSTPQGNFSYSQYVYNRQIEGFRVQIKYAQVALCQIINAQILIPINVDQQTNFSDYPVRLVAVIIFCLVIALI